jgi:proteic killer suppression protein
VEHFVALHPQDRPTPQIIPEFIKRNNAVNSVLRGVTLDNCKVTGYSLWVRIRNFLHKGLKRLYTEDSAKGLPPDAVDKLRKMLMFLNEMEEPDELRALPGWKAHTLTGNRKGLWSLNVTRNWRLTFSVDIANREIVDLNLEDYH